MTVTIRPQETESSRPDPSRDERHQLTVVGALVALSLDAMASVAYGPEAVANAVPSFHKPGARRAQHTESCSAGCSPSC